MYTFLNGFDDDLRTGEMFVNVCAKWVCEPFIVHKIEEHAPPSCLIIENMTKFEDLVQKLQARGVIVIQQEPPRRSQDPVPMRCSTFGHQFDWDLKFVKKILDDKHLDDYPCICIDCRSNYIARTIADQECTRLGIVLVDATSTSFTYQLPCGHQQTTDTKLIKKRTRAPTCLECCKQAANDQKVDEATASETDSAYEKAIIDNLVKKLNRLKGQNRQLTEHDVKDVLDYIVERLNKFEIDFETGYYADEKNMWVDIKCSGKDGDSDHRSTYDLRQMLYVLKRIIGGYKTHPCHYCNKKKVN